MEAQLRRKECNRKYFQIHKDKLTANVPYNMCGKKYVKIYLEKNIRKMHYNKK